MVLVRVAEWVERRPKTQEAEGKGARYFLAKAVAEIEKLRADSPDVGRLSRAWEEAGGGLVLCRPLGLTVLGTLGGEVFRRAFEAFAEDFGESAAGWLGGHRHPAGCGARA